MNLGVIVALGVFGAFILLTAIITTVYMLVKRLVKYMIPFPL